jgi:DNA-binding winged helix-turn-helix (wHTH) protein
MARAVHQSRVYVIGLFRLRPDELVVERDGATVALTPKAVQTLLVLVESAGDVVSKEALFQRVWPGTFVVESSLTRNISALRKVLEEDGGLEGAIETIPKRGYRFRLPWASSRTKAGSTQFQRPRTGGGQPQSGSSPSRELWRGVCGHQRQASPGHPARRCAPA